MEGEDRGALGDDPHRPEEVRLHDLEADNSRLRSELNVKDQEIENLRSKVEGLSVSFSLCICEICMNVFCSFLSNHWTRPTPKNRYVLHTTLFLQNKGRRPSA